MLKFVTDVRGSEPDILAGVKNEMLLIISIDGQLLQTFEAPEEGWEHDSLVKLAESFPEQWSFCGADAMLGEQWVGSTEV